MHETFQSFEHKNCVHQCQHRHWKTVWVFSRARSTELQFIPIDRRKTMYSMCFDISPWRMCILIKQTEQFHFSFKIGVIIHFLWRPTRQYFDDNCLREKSKVRYRAWMRWVNCFLFLRFYIVARNGTCMQFLNVSQVSRDLISLNDSSSTELRQRTFASIANLFCVMEILMNLNRN